MNVLRNPFMPQPCQHPLAVCVGLFIAMALSGCGAIVSNVSNGLAEDLSSAILNQDDPELVREALPAYLLMLDSFVWSNPDDRGTLSATAQLYTAYGAVLVEDASRAKKLTARARDYGNRALCSSAPAACELDGIDFDTYSNIIGSLDEDDADALYSYSLANLAWIRTHSDNYSALADLPKIELALEHLMMIDPGDMGAGTSMYLGILKTLRPAALGGDPEAGKRWFERGIALSQGRDLSIKVEYARNYARQSYDRELHDRLLNEVLRSEVRYPNLLLFNLLAQEQALILLNTADDYF
jgi:hypothetical protein